MKITWIFTLCVIGFGAIGRLDSAPNKADCDKKAFDRCNERLYMIGDDTFVFPKNIPEMNKRCKELKTLEWCAKNFASNCLSRDTKQSINVLMYGVTKSNKGYCSSNKKKQAFIKMTSCISKNKKKLDQTMWQLASDFKAIADLTQDTKMKIPLACCNYYKYKQLQMSNVNKNCSPEEATEFEFFLDSNTGDALNLLCGDYTEESDKCSKIIGQTPKWTKKHPSKSFVLPMVDVMNSI